MPPTCCAPTTGTKASSDYEMNAGLGFEELEDFAIDFVDAMERRFPATTGRVLFYSVPVPGQHEHRPAGAVQ